MKENDETLGAVVKANLLAEVDYDDDYLNDNAATILAGVPQPARGVLSNSQHARMFNIVNTKRYIKES